MRRYLIVDDNVSLAENLAEILMDVGDEVVIARGGLEALALIAKERFDALLTDMKMPGMTGLELLRKAHEVDPGLPVLIMTAYTGDGDLAASEACGILGVVSKPLAVEELLGRIGAARRNALVAVIDDNAQLAEAVSDMLRTRGFSTMVAASVEATDRLGPTAPFLALVDYRVPGGPDGEAFRHARTRFPAASMAIMTGYATTISESLGAPVYEKPFAPAALIAHVESVYGAQ